MDAGIEANSESEIAQLHSQAIAEAAADGPGEGDQGAGNQASDVDCGASNDAAVAKDILASALSWHADAVESEFKSALEPAAKIVGQSQIDRIAGRARMSPEIQTAIAEHGSRTLDKYGLAKYVRGEIVLIGAVLAYMRQLHLSKKERDEILAALKPAAPAAQPAEA